MTSLRHFTSRWLKTALGRGLGLITLALAVLLPVPAWAVTLYSNTDGNITDWVEMYDPNANHTLTDNGNDQKYAATSSTNSYARYRYGTQTWTDYYFQVKYVGQYFLGGTNFIHVGVRADGMQTGNPQMGYFFQHNIGTGSWQAANGGLAPTWTTVLSNSCTIAAGSIIKVEVSGSGAATVVSIYVGGTKYFEVTNPGTFYDAGTCGIGLNTNYSAAYILMDDLLVESTAAAPTATTTITPTATPSATEVISPTCTPTPTITPTATCTPTSTLTPGINTLTHADHFIYLPDQWAQFPLNTWLPDYDWDGGVWSDLSDIWKVGFGGTLWGAAGNKNAGAGKGYTGGIFNLGTIVYPVMYNVGLKVLELFEINPIKGFTFRQGPAGALHVEVDASSATITAIRLKEFDSAGNTIVVATGSAPAIGPRPGYYKSALTIVDDSTHLKIYFDPSFLPMYSAAYVTATTKVLEVDSTKYNTQGQMSWLWTSGNSAMAVDFVSVVENFATSTPTATPTHTPTVTATATFIPYWILIKDNAARPVTVDDQAREINIDNKARTIKIRRNP